VSITLESIASKLTTRDERALLTPAETRVLELLCEGKVTKVIAHELGLSKRTVDQQRAALMRKVGCDTGVQLGIWAQRNGYARGVKL
jgi:DNA-binding NarL/FixJ family response regulator